MKYFRVSWCAGRSQPRQGPEVMCDECLRELRKMGAWGIDSIESLGPCDLCRWDRAVVRKEQ